MPSSLIKNKTGLIFISLSGFVSASVCASDNAKIHSNISSVLSKTHYKPRIELGLKTGSKRDLSRLGAVIPLHETQSGLWFTNLFGLWDSSGASEGNFGLGYRHLIDDEWIIGGYGFYDRRKTSYHNRFQQFTLGAEALRENLEFRINGYVPIGNKVSFIQVQKVQRVINTIPLFEQNTQKEEALYGFDVEAGGNLPQFTPLEGFLAYYQFFNSEIKLVLGVRLRGQLNLNPYLSLEGEISHDRLRKTAYFLGIKLGIQLGKKKPTGLYSKMTQMAIRDIDIVTDVKAEQKRESISGKPLEENNTYMEVSEEEMVLYNPEADLRKFGLKTDASKHQIKKAADRFRLKHHPDKTGTDYELYHKAQFLEFQEAYERLIHWREEWDAGREVWIKKSLSSFHPTAQESVVYRSSSQALVLYQRPKEILKARSLNPSPVEITHFTGSGRENISKIVLYSPKEIALITRNSLQSFIKVDNYNLEGIPVGLPVNQLQKFADSSFWQVRSLSDGSYKVSAYVKGLGGGKIISLKQSASDNQQNINEIKIDIEAFKGIVEYKDGTKELPLVINFTSGSVRGGRTNITKAVQDLNSEKRQTFLTQDIINRYLVKKDKLEIFVTQKPKKIKPIATPAQTVQSALAPLLAFANQLLQTNTVPLLIRILSGEEKAVTEMREQLQQNNIDISSTHEFDSTFDAAVLNLSWLLNQSPENQEMFKANIKNFMESYHLSSIISMLSVFKDATLFKAYPNISLAITNMINDFKGSTSVTQTSTGTPNLMVMMQEMQNTSTFYETLTQIQTIGKQVFPNLVLDMDNIVIVFKNLLSIPSHREWLNKITSAISTAIVGFESKNTQTYLNRLDKLSKAITAFVPLSSKSMNQIEFNAIPSKLADMNSSSSKNVTKNDKVKNKKPQPSSTTAAKDFSNKQINEINSLRANGIFGRVNWKDLIFAISFFHKLHDGNISGVEESSIETINYFAQKIYETLKQIQAIYLPKIADYFRKSQQEQDQQIGIFQGDMIHVEHKELYYQEHFMSLLKKHLDILADIKEHNTIAERAVIFRVAQILGEMDHQLPPEVKKTYTPITPWKDVHTVRDALTHPQDILNGVPRVHNLLVSQDQEIKDMFAGIRVQFMRINGNFALPSEINVLRDISEKNYFTAFMSNLLQIEMLMQEKFKKLKDNFEQYVKEGVTAYLSSIKTYIKTSKLQEIKPIFLPKDDMDEMNTWIRLDKLHNQQLQELEDNFPDDDSKLDSWHQHIFHSNSIPAITNIEWAKITTYDQSFTAEENNIKLITFKYLILNQHRKKLNNKLDIVDTEQGLGQFMPKEFVEGKDTKNGHRYLFSDLLKALDTFQNNVKQKFQEIYVKTIFDSTFNDSFNMFTDLTEFKGRKKDGWKTAFGNTEYPLYHPRLMNNFDEAVKTLIQGNKKEKLPSLELPNNILQSIRTRLEKDAVIFFSEFNPANFQSTFDESIIKKSLKKLMNLFSFNTSSTPTQAAVKELVSDYMLTLIRGEILRQGLEDESLVISQMAEFERDFKISLPEHTKKDMFDLIKILSKTFFSASQRIIGNNLAHENFDLDFWDSEDLTSSANTKQHDAYTDLNEIIYKQDILTEQQLELLAHIQAINLKVDLLIQSINMHKFSIAEVLLKNGVLVASVGKEGLTAIDAILNLQDKYKNATVPDELLTLAHQAFLQAEVEELAKSMAKSFLPLFFNKNKTQNPYADVWMTEKQILNLIDSNPQKNGVTSRGDTLQVGFGGSMFIPDTGDGQPLKRFAIHPVGLLGGVRDKASLSSASGRHWTLLITDNEDKKAYYFDSKGDYAKSAISVKGAVHNTYIGYEFIHLLSDKVMQPDGSTCGTWVNKVAEIILRELQKNQNKKVRRIQNDIKSLDSVKIQSEHGNNIQAFYGIKE